MVAVQEDGVAAVDDVSGVVIWKHVVHDEGVEHGFPEGPETVNVAANLVGRVLDYADGCLLELRDWCGLQGCFDLPLDAVFRSGLFAPVGALKLVHRQRWTSGAVTVDDGEQVGHAATPLRMYAANMRSAVGIGVRLGVPRPVLQIFSPIVGRVAIQVANL